LSTKKLLPNLVGAAAEKDIEITEESFISTNPILTEEKSREISKWFSAGIEYAVFTSSNAIRPFETYLKNHVNHDLPGWKIFTLSGKTKEELNKPYAKQLGSLSGVADSASDLASKILEENIGEIIFFCGNQRRDELPQILRHAGVLVHEVVVYETIETPVALKNNFNGILFFSPSAVRSFFSANQLYQGTVCFAIGKTTADAISANTHNQIITSPSPSQEELLNQLYSFVEHLPGKGYQQDQDNKD
jgi:uroporphyrinogen-III synthase